MRTILITGADGYVGSRLLHDLLARQHDAVAGVRNRARKLSYERKHIKSLVCDPADPISVARVVAAARPHAVVHLASLQPVAAGDEPLEAYHSIVSACANLLDAVRRTVPRARVLIASSAEVYGAAVEGGAPAEESMPTQPATTLGSLFRSAESIAQTFHRDFHLDVTIARMFQFVGPGQPEAYYWGAVARQLMEYEADGRGGPLALPDLDCQRDVLHIDDAVSACAVLLESGLPSEVYNVCSGQLSRCRDLVERAAQAMGITVALEALLPEGEPPAGKLWGSNAKLTALGWRPVHTVEEAVRELAASYRTSRTAARR